MHTVTLDVHDSIYDQVMTLLEKLPKDKLRIKEDKIAAEIADRCARIDSGEEELTPYREGMDAMMDKIRSKHAAL